MAQLKDLLQLVREKCSGMLDQQAIDQLKKSYRSFCIESGYVKQRETAIRNIDGSVTLYPELDHYIISINTVIETKWSKELKQSIDYTVNSANEITLLPDHQEVIVDYSIAPILPMSDSIDASEQLLQRWPDELASGAAALLRRMPKKPWTDFELADYYYRDFVKGHREAYKVSVTANDEIQFQPQSTRNFF